MRKLIGLFALLSALGVLAVGATGASATESNPLGTEGPLAESTAETAPEPVASPAIVGCEAYVICSYAAAEFGGGNPIHTECSNFGEVPIGSKKYSAINRCGNKSNQLRYNGAFVACMNPGGERPNPGVFNEVYVYPEYGAMC